MLIARTISSPHYPGSSGLCGRVFRGSEVQDTGNEWLQKALRAANDEVSQLKATVNALRDALELRKQNHLQQMQNLELAYRSELSELQQMVKVMREKLEEVHARAR